MMARQKQHLYEVDLMRAFIMLGVLSVHTITAFMANLDNSSAPYLGIAALHSSMHFTRESFMFITGLVLFITYYHKQFNPLQFWGKRLLLVGIPFIIWAVIDTVWSQIYRPHPNLSASYLVPRILHLLMFGDNFHLYYILVSIQLYLVFPLLLYVIKKLERWHAYIFLASFVFQLALMAFYEFWMPHMNKSAWPAFLVMLARNHGTFILTYQFWFVAGGMLACHYQKVVAFVRQHAKKLGILLLAGVLCMWCIYFLNRFALHMSPGAAESVDQPIMIPYALLITAGIWYGGILWSKKRDNPRISWFSKFIKLASNASFGIYLLQVYPLHFVQLMARQIHVPLWLYFAIIPLAILFVYFSAMAVAWAIGKVPVISYMVGRKVKLMRVQKQQVSVSA